MRELIVKNLTSEDHTHSELLLSEHMEHKGLIRDIEKRTVYTVKYILRFKSERALKHFIQKAQKKIHPPQVYVVKRSSSAAGLKKVLYKITGEQILIVGQCVLLVKLSQNVKKITFRKSL